jgi:O-antigen/teichoic acid export membrane protein
MRYVPVRLLPALASLAAVPILTSLISPSDYGAFYLISSIAMLLSYIAVGWISSALVRFYWPSRREGRLDEYTATVVWSSGAALVSTAIVAALVAWYARDSIPGNVASLIPVALLFFLFNYATDVFVQVLRASKQASVFARVQVGGALLSTGLSVVLVWTRHMGAAGIFAAGAIAWALMLFPILRAIRSQGSISPVDVSRPMLSQFWRYGLPLVPVGISSWALVLIDRFVVQAYHGTTQVGLYSVAYSLGAGIIQLVTVPLLLTMAPSLMEVYEHQGQALAEKVQTQFIRYFAILTVPILFGLAAASQSFMHVFTGREYWSAWPVLAIVAAGSMFSSFSQIATSGLSIHKKTRLIMVDALAAAVFNLVANLVLVPSLGYIAAAYNTVAAYFLMMALTWWQSRYYMRLRVPWADMARIVGAAAVMGLAVWLPFTMVMPTAPRTTALIVLLAQTIIGIAIYAGLLFLFREITNAEIDFGREIAGKIGARLRRG